MHLKIKNLGIYWIYWIKATFLHTRENFFPSSHLAREPLGWDYRWDRSRKVTSAVQEDRKELENYVQYFKTCKESSMGQSDHKSRRLANRNQQRRRVWSFLFCTVGHIESKARKQARMVTLASRPDGSPPTGGVDYGRKNDLFCTSYCWIVPRCVNKAAVYSNNIYPGLSWFLLYPYLEKNVCYIS